MEYKKLQYSNKGIKHIMPSKEYCKAKFIRIRVLPKCTVELF